MQALPGEVTFRLSPSTLAPRGCLLHPALPTSGSLQVFRLLPGQAFDPMVLNKLLTQSSNSWFNAASSRKLSLTFFPPIHTQTVRDPVLRGQGKRREDLLTYIGCLSCVGRQSPEVQSLRGGPPSSSRATARAEVSATMATFLLQLSTYYVPESTLSAFHV